MSMWKTSSAVENRNTYWTRAPGWVVLELYVCRSRAMPANVASASWICPTNWLPSAFKDSEVLTTSRDRRFVPEAMLGQVASPAGADRLFSGMETETLGL